jgi:glycerophosphoryl diester phosphodiesterase
MKNSGTILTVFLLLVACYSIGQQDKRLTEMQIRQHFNWVMKEMHNPKSKNILVVAHRGDWRNAPENSIQALRNSIEMGVDIMEIDLKMTKDSVLVLMHDKTIDRTMSGKGQPSSYTLDSLKMMTLKSAHGGPTTHHIPTFEEFMTEAKGRMFINIDKCYPYYKQVYDVLKRTGTLDQVLMNGEKDLDKNRQDYGDLLKVIPFKPVVDVNKMSVAAVENYISFRPKVMEVVFATDTSRFVQHPGLIQNNNIKIYINSLWADLCAGHNDDLAVEQGDTKDSWDWILLHGATIIQTDRPAQLLSYLRDKKLRPF